jgi:hypothetical protein
MGVVGKRGWSTLETARIASELLFVRRSLVAPTRLQAPPNGTTSEHMIKTHLKVRLWTVLGGAYEREARLVYELYEIRARAMHAAGLVILFLIEIVILILIDFEFDIE